MPPSPHTPPGREEPLPGSSPSLPTSNSPSGGCNCWPGPSHRCHHHHRNHPSTTPPTLIPHCFQGTPDYETAILPNLSLGKPRYGEKECGQGSDLGVISDTRPRSCPGKPRGAIGRELVSSSWTRTQHDSRPRTSAGRASKVFQILPPQDPP